MTRIDFGFVSVTEAGWVRDGTSSHWRSGAGGHVRRSTFKEVSGSGLTELKGLVFEAGRTTVHLKERPGLRCRRAPAKS